MQSDDLGPGAQVRAPDVAANAVNGSDVVNGSIAGADIASSALPKGRKITSSCDPTGPTFVDCGTVTVSLPRPGLRVLIVASAMWSSDPPTQAERQTALPDLGKERVEDALAARALHEIAATGDIGLSRRNVPRLPCGQVEKRLLALVKLDPIGKAGSDRLDHLSAGIGVLTHRKPS